MSAADGKQWYFCLEHDKVEREGEGCRLDRAMGPYATAEAAANWKQTAEARNEAWDEEDRRWEGD